MIPALKVVAHSREAVERAELAPDRLAELRARTAGEGAVAFIVKAADLGMFRELGDVVTDRGKKGAKKELSRLLLGHTRVPIVAGSYTSTGQLRRSVRTLLRRANRQGDRNLFIIGTEENVFDALWTDTRPAERTILDLIPPAKLPDGLAQKFIGTSLQARLVRHLIVRAAQIDEPVLIIGDTGTGKEVVARSIHEYGRRRHETFIAVNCAAIPQDLFESELFGHEPESFTGAVHRKLGLWRMADRGTLFLDEIGDLRIDHQAKILRALQDGALRPVGGVERKVNARVVAATNRDLPAMVGAGRFREDLYYRLRSFFIPTPSLKSHPEDVPLLAQAFWKTIARDPVAVLDEKVVRVLADREWPGNARELRAVLTNLSGLFGTTITLEHVSAAASLQQMVSEGRTSGDADPNALDCVRHLRRVADVVRAAQVAATVIADGRRGGTPVARRAFNHRLAELEMVCLRPGLFGSDAAFQAVAGLRRRLAAGLSGIAGPDRAAWREDLEPRFALALSVVLREIEHLSSARP